ncbi:hypothetical protein [Micromonospora sp. S-DT3-3-22]|uniref:hypothetical protein n=1 Tax=Micromonospora sp. S-DT3-3-22 TaxID=2755359 RepID=UPI00188DCDCE|nr:hypothetical protein [Micromonospora sp. S-DT3-3-22]
MALSASGQKRLRKVAKWLLGALLGLLISIVDQSQDIFIGKATITGIISNGTACTVVIGALIASMSDVLFDFDHAQGQARWPVLTMQWGHVLTLSTAAFIMGAMKMQLTMNGFNPNIWSGFNTVSVVLLSFTLPLGLISVFLSEGS